MNRNVVLEGGPCDGLTFTTNAENVLLMPTDRAAATGRAPSTAPYFAEYRPNGESQQVPWRGKARVFAFVGIGVDATAEEVPEQMALEA